MFKRITHSFILICLMITFFTLTPPQTARAITGFPLTVFTVTNTNDSGAGSLRQALIDASPGDTIVFDSSLTGATITLSSTLSISKDITIDGSSLSSHINISGNNAVRVFYNPAHTVNLIDLNIINGNGVAGAGIYSAGTLSIANSSFTNNNSGASNPGGALYLFGGSTTISNSTFTSNTSSGSGAAIYLSNSGNVSVTNSTFSNNNGIAGTIILLAATTGTITNSTFSGNNGSQDGVAIYNNGTLHLKNTILANSAGGADCKNQTGGSIATDTNNLIETNASAPYNCGTPTVTGDPMLGPLASNGNPVGSTQTMALLYGSPAIDAGDNTVCSASPVNNLDQNGGARPIDGDTNRTATCDIGAVEFTPVTRYVATGGSDTGNNCANSATPCQTILQAYNEALDGDTISIAAGTYTEAGQIDVSKHLFFSGAGVNQTILSGGNSHRVFLIRSSYKVSITGLEIENGKEAGASGGGIYTDGDLTLAQVKITNNSASWTGGGIYVAAGNLDMTYSTVSGNEILNTGHGGGLFINTPATATLSNVTVSGNSTDSLSGGIHMQGNTLTLTNVTISGNTSQGLLNTGSATTTILNSTITDNSDNGITNYATIDIKNSIVADNAGAGNDCYNGGTLTSQGNNISSDASCNFVQTGDQSNTNPQLALLANYGGDTETHALLSGSPAIDTGNNAGCPATDQRGITRPQDGEHNATATCDIGAFEATESPIVIYVTRTGANPTNAANVDFTVTFSEAVTGVDTTDFTLTTTAGINNASASSVSGSGNIYTVTVNSGTGNGDLQLNVIADGTIQDTASNALSGGFTSGEAYTVVKIMIPMADFDGDGKAEKAVFRPSNSTWYIYGVGSFSYGQAGDIPVPADYNGDGKDEIAVFRPSNSTWYIYGIGPFVYGQAGDIPVPADYDGDGKDDIAVFRPSNSTWYIYGSGTFTYGTTGDIPVVADYNGDGKANIAVFRPTNSTWYIYGVGPFTYGTVGDIPVIADYTGNGKADIAVFRPSNSTWYLYGIGPSVYGQSGDIPVVADYDGDNKADIAVFRPSNSTWYLRGIGSFLYGGTGDIPVSPSIFR